MLAILEIQGAAGGGRKIWLGDGQMVRIGRTEQADVALPQDKSLAAVHFTLTCGGGQCSARADGGSVLSLNGHIVQQCVLRSGDVLQAGGTRFVVTIEGAAESTKADEANDQQEPSADSSLPTQRDIQCDVQQSAAGTYFYRLRGSSDKIHAAFRQLKGTGFVHVIADRQCSWLNDQTPRATLLSWLPDRVSDASPDVVVDVESSRAELLRHAVADRETTLVVAPISGDELLEHLRLAARGQMLAEEQPNAQHMLLSFDAATLEDVLPQCDHGFIDFLFSKLTAVFYWSDDASWVIVGRNQLDVSAFSSRTAGSTHHAPAGNLPLDTETLVPDASPECVTY